MKAQAIMQIMGFGATGVGASISAVKSFGFVPEGSVGVKLRWGKVVRYSCDKYAQVDGKQGVIHKMGDVIYYEPGWRWIIPFTHKFRSETILDQFLNLPHHLERLSDDSVFTVKSVVGYRVIAKEAYTAMYGVKSYHEALTALCVTELREVLAEKSHEEFRLAKDINELLLQAVKAEARKWGIEVFSFKIVESAATDATETYIQIPRIIEQRAQSVQENASKLDDIDPAVATALLGGAVISTGTYETKDARKPGVIIPLQIVPEHTN